MAHRNDSEQAEFPSAAFGVVLAEVGEFARVTLSALAVLAWRQRVSLGAMRLPSVDRRRARLTSTGVVPHALHDQAERIDAGRGVAQMADRESLGDLSLPDFVGRSMSRNQSSRAVCATSHLEPAVAPFVLGRIPDPASAFGNFDVGEEDAFSLDSLGFVEHDRQDSSTH